MKLYRCGICGVEVDGFPMVLQCGVCKTVLCRAHYECGACKAHFAAIDEADKQVLRECQHRMDKASPDVHAEGCKYAIICSAPAALSMFLVVFLGGKHVDESISMLIAITITAMLVGCLVIVTWNMVRRVQANQQRRGQERERMARILARYALKD